MPGDGGGNQRGAALLQQVDGVLGFGGEGVEFGGFSAHKRHYCLLLRNWRDRNDEIVDLFRTDVRHAYSRGVGRKVSYKHF
mgnify:CR=1 FL=1